MPLRKRSYTQELRTNQMGEVLKVGYLKKKGHVRRNWLDRWFVLTTEALYYYKNRTVSEFAPNSFLAYRPILLVLLSL